MSVVGSVASSPGPSASQVGEETPNTKRQRTTASPGGGGNNNADSLHIYAQKFPRPMLTGNKSLDGDVLARHSMSQRVIDAMVRDRNHAAALYNEVNKREAAAAQTRGATSETLMQDLTTFKKIDDPFSLNFIVKAGKIADSSTLVACQSKYSDTFSELMTFETQMPGTVRMPDALRISPVLLNFCTKQSEDHGNRLAAFVAKGGITPTGLNWKFGSYEPRYDENTNLVSIKFINGDEVSVEDSGITSKHVVSDNFNDWSAKFNRPPGAGVKIHLFFKKSKLGPYKTQQLTSGGKWFQTCVESALTQWEKAKEAATAGALADTATALAALNEGKSQKNKDKAAGARKKAIEALERKRQARTVNFESSGGDEVPVPTE